MSSFTELLNEASRVNCASFASSSEPAAAPPRFVATLKRAASTQSIRSKITVLSDDRMRIRANHSATDG
jgi:hypothetical protein